MIKNYVKNDKETVQLIIILKLTDNRFGCPGIPGVSPPPKAVVYVVLCLTITIGVSLM